MWCLFGWIDRWYSPWTKLESDILKGSSHRVVTQNSVGMTSKNILLLCVQSEMDYCLWIGLQALTVVLLPKMASRNIDSSLHHQSRNCMKLLTGNGTHMLACVVSVCFLWENYEMETYQIWNSSICTALLLQLQEMFSNSFIKHDMRLQIINIDKNPKALLKTMPLH